MMHGQTQIKFKLSTLIIFGLCILIYDTFLRDLLNREIRKNTQGYKIVPLTNLP